MCFGTLPFRKVKGHIEVFPIGDIRFGTLPFRKVKGPMKHRYSIFIIIK